MNIIDFWKDYVSERTHYSQYDRNDFLQALADNVPNWKEQVKNRDIWPDLHCYGRNINETIYTDVIIGLSYCTKHISSNWSSFPRAVQDKILSFHLKQFLDECLRNADLWKNLSTEQKASVLREAEQSERSYVFDIMLFNLWSNELNYKDTPYVHFVSPTFQHLKEELSYETDMRRRQDILRHMESRLGGWNMPTASNVFTRLHYTPSERLSTIQQVAIDDESAQQVDAAIRQIRNLVE